MSDNNQPITDDDKSRPMTDVERSRLLAEVKAAGNDMNQSDRDKLVAKLDADLEAFIAQQKSSGSTSDSPHTPATDEDIEKLAEELNNHPAFLKDFDPNKPLSEATEAMMALKYDDNAEAYKDDGNKNFKMKKYRWAIDNYTEGIKCKSSNRELNAVLYCNRAAAHFWLGNYRSSWKDVILARKFKPDHMKAFIRGAQCCVEMKRYEEAMKWCDDGMLLNPLEEKLLDLRGKADKLRKQADRERRKELAKERRENEEDLKLLHEIRSRGVTLAGIKSPEAGEPSKLDPLMLSSLESNHPSKAKVFLNPDTQRLEWPVLFLYPEYGESDFIARFDEAANFADHIAHMFGPASERVPWDTERKYIPDNIEIYFENKDMGKLFRVKPSMTLSAVLKNKKYIVYGGTPGFILLVKDSQFAKTFLKQYENA